METCHEVSFKAHDVLVVVFLFGIVTSTPGVMGISIKKLIRFGIRSHLHHRRFNYKVSDKMFIIYLPGQYHLQSLIVHHHLGHHQNYRHIQLNRRLTLEPCQRTFCPIRTLEMRSNRWKLSEIVCYKIVKNKNYEPVC